MKFEIVICDKCSRGNDDNILVTSYRIYRDKEMDASGNGYNIIWDYVDYCDECFKSLGLRNNKNIEKI